jgi:hypothetical protein
MRRDPSARAERMLGWAARLASVAAGMALLSTPRLAHACSVCFGGEDSDWTTGFLLGAIVMLALPPAIVVTAGVAIYRATKRQEARQRLAESGGVAAVASPDDASPRKLRPV